LGEGIGKIRKRGETGEKSKEKRRKDKGKK
jgi:hypothetical protein